MAGWFQSTFNGRALGTAPGNVTDAELQKVLDASGSSALGTTIQTIKDALATSAHQANMRYYAAAPLDVAKMTNDYATRMYSASLTPNTFNTGDRSVGGLAGPQSAVVNVTAQNSSSSALVSGISRGLTAAGIKTK